MIFADLVCCSHDDSVELAAGVMIEAHAQYLFALDERRRLIGALSAPDLAGYVPGQPAFEVVFYKEVLDHFGFPHHIELMRVLATPGTREKAVCRAIPLFEQEKQFRRWTVAADGYDVIEVNTCVRSMTRLRPVFLRSGCAFLLEVAVNRDPCWRSAETDGSIWHGRSLRSQFPADRDA